ncbi:Protein Y97E10AR.7, partial [Aphelenchoides avenae]
MLKTRALEKYLSQASGPGVTDIMLFNKEGLTLGRVGSTNRSGGAGNVYAALMSNIWETFERQ